MNPVRQHFSLHLDKYVSLVAGVLLMLAKIDWSPLGLPGAKIAGGIAVGVTISRALGITPAKVASTAASLLVGFLILASIHGCANAPAVVSQASAVVTSADAQPIITAAAEVAVATAEQKGVSAAQILSIAQQALAADQGAGSTLASVATVVNAQLAKLNLPAGDLAAAQVLEAALNTAILAKIGSNATVAQLQAAVADVIDAIIVAAGGTPTSSSPSTTQTVVPADGATVARSGATVASRPTALAAVVSPPVLGAAASTILVACLTAFTHVQVSAPTAAAMTVLFTFGNAELGW